MMTYPYAPLGPTLHVIALMFMLVFVVAVSGVAVWLAGLPGRIAAKRGHRQSEAISVCGWVGFLTGFLWVVALVWAFVKNSGTDTPTDSPDELASLSAQVRRLETVAGKLELQRGRTP